MFTKKKSKHARTSNEEFPAPSVQSAAHDAATDGAAEDVADEHAGKSILFERMLDINESSQDAAQCPTDSAANGEAGPGSSVIWGASQDDDRAPSTPAQATPAPAKQKRAAHAQETSFVTSEGSESSENPSREFDSDSFMDESDQELAEFVASYRVPIVSAPSDNDRWDVLSSDVPMPYSVPPINAPGDEAFFGNAPVPMPVTMQATESRKNTGKTVGIICGIVIGLLLIAYIAGAVYFKGHMFPHTEVGDSDVSLMSTAEVQAHLESKTANYELAVSGYGYELTLPGKDIGFSFDSAAVAKSMHDQQNVLAWPVECFADHDYTEKVVATYNETAVKQLVTSTVETHNSSATDPKDARIGYNESTNRVVVLPEEYGTKLDAEATNAAVKKAICSATRVLALAEGQLVQPAVKQDNAKLKKAAEGCNSLTRANMSFTVDGTVAFKAGLSCIDQWIDIAEDGSVTLNDEKISEWISKTASDYTTLGNTRTYTRADGKEVSVTGGDYGWEVDEDAFRATILLGLETDSQETFEMPFTETGITFNGVGKQDWGERYIDVDLTEQHAYMYDELGELIWESDIVSGNVNVADRATPEGVWSINLMKQNVTLYTYEAGEEEPSETLVYYWMPFVGNTIGLHDAWWQAAFGGTRYRDGYGSHGCINLPTSAAQELYSIAEVDDVVVTHW